MHVNKTSTIKSDIDLLGVVNMLTIDLFNLKKILIVNRHRWVKQFGVILTSDMESW